jgi:hypothetical protein
VPYTTPVPDTLFVDSTDLQALDGVVFAEGAIAGLLAPAIRRGSNTPVPRKAGEPAAPKVIDAYQFTIHVVVTPTTETNNLLNNRAQVLANYTALLAALAGNGGVVTLTRRLTASATTHTDATAAGEFLGAANLQWPDLETIEVDLQFKNCDGRWWDATSSTWLVP